MSINAVMLAIKPSIFGILFTMFDEKMVKDYLYKVKMAKYKESDPKTKK